MNRSRNPIQNLPLLRIWDSARVATRPLYRARPDLPSLGPPLKPPLISNTYQHLHTCADLGDRSPATGFQPVQRWLVDFGAILSSGMDLYVWPENMGVESLPDLGTWSRSFLYCRTPLKRRFEQYDHV